MCWRFRKGPGQSGPCEPQPEFSDGSRLQPSDARSPRHPARRDHAAEWIVDRRATGLPASASESPLVTVIPTADAEPEHRYALANHLRATSLH